MIVQGEDQVEHQGDILPQIENIDETGRVCDTVRVFELYFLTVQSNLSVQTRL